MDVHTKVKTVQTIGLLSAVVGLVVMLAWVFGIPFFKSFILDFTTMKFSTALCFLFGGIILRTLVTPMPGKETIKKYALLLFSILILLTMTPVFLALVTQNYWGWPPQFILDKALPGAPLYSVLPSIGTSIAFIFMGLSILITHIFSRYTRYALLYAGSIIHFLSMIALIGFLLDSPLLYYEIESWSAGISFHAALLFFLLGTGLFLVGSLAMGNCPYYKGMDGHDRIKCGYDWAKHRK